MNYKMVGRFLAQILTVEGLFMIPAVIIGYVCGEDNAMQALLWSILIIAVVVVFLRLTCRHAASGFYAKEGLACVGLGWIGMSLFGGLPFFIAREIPNYVDALFEIVSGFTTTGSSILPAVEDMSQCLLYWRSFSHWLVWVCWCSCLRLCRQEARAEAIRCTFFVRKARDRSLVNWFLR